MRSPVISRVAPFAIFLILTSLQGVFGEAGRYWIYFAKTLVGAWLVWEMRSVVTEMRWAFSWQAVVVGGGIFGIWVGLDNFYPHLPWGTGGTSWAPFRQFGDGSAAAWFFILVRILGSTLVVPPLEEVFYRSFIYRNVVKSDFQSVSLTFFSWSAFLFASVMFGFEHPQWLAGILCGMAYQWLVLRKGRLGEAMTAHAITNFLLGLWIVWQGAWKFW